MLSDFGIVLLHIGCNVDGAEIYDTKFWRFIFQILSTEDFIVKTPKKGYIEKKRVGDVNEATSELACLTPDSRSVVVSCGLWR